jgi:hypothetical protein
MLSSILQQNPSDIEITVDAGYVLETGKPTCKEVLNFFENEGLRVKHTAYDKNEIDKYQKRGWVRNRQLANCDTEWIWFGDCDMVLESNFFIRLSETIKGLSPDERQRMLTCARFSTNKPPDATNALVDKYTYPCVVNEAYDQAVSLPKRRTRNVGAGYCQIAEVDNLNNNHNGLYADPVRNRDFNWDRFWKTKSDVHFRKKVGRLRVDLPPFIHLQHIRDNEVGEHIEVQR